MQDQLPHPLIKHVVVLMLENRGFDHIMGWLYAANETPTIVGTDQQAFMGLSTVQAAGQLGLLQNPLPKNNGLLPINQGARSPKTPSFNTGESFQHIMNQLWGVAEPSVTWFDRQKRQTYLQQLQQQIHTTVPPMTGFVLDYDEEVFHLSKQHLDREGLSEVLDTYTPEQMPVLSGLARAYTVSDSWFCSVPSQTNTNRAFSMTGTSRGLVNNSFYDPPSWNPALSIAKHALMEGKSHADALPVSTRSLFEVLQQANYSWKVWWQGEWPPKGMTAGMEWQYTRTMIPLLLDKQYDGNFVKFDGGEPQSAFFDAARKGELPALSWIEPLWGGGPSWKPVSVKKQRGVGNDYHPVSDTTTGEDFVMNVYLALAQSPVWQNTLLVITFDENGGTYDHVSPPAPMLPSGNDGCPLPHPPIDRHDMDPTTRTQFGFDFSQYGVRVPTLLVSPCAPAQTIFRSTSATPYDHTSLIATILTLAGIPPTQWMLGERVANAPTFEGVLAPPQVRDPASALSVPFKRSNLEVVTCNTDYVFEYVGDIWHRQPGSLYLAASSSGSMGYFKYPTLTSDPAQALKFRVVPDGGGPSTEMLLNMALVMLKTGEQALSGTPFFTVDWQNSYAYYDKNQGLGSRWQVRILGSRNPRDEVRVGDYVYFVSKLKPPPYRPGLIAPDPYQRLCASPADASYVSTQAGEWALWRLHPAVGDDNV